METSPLPVKGCKFWPVYNGHLWGPVTLTSIAERLAVELSILFTTYYCRGWDSNTQPSGANALTHFATAAVPGSYYRSVMQLACHKCLWNRVILRMKRSSMSEKVWLDKDPSMPKNESDQNLFNLYRPERYGLRPYEYCKVKQIKVLKYWNPDLNDWLIFRCFLSSSRIFYSYRESPFPMKDCKN